jgi:hypothetical protein
METKINTVMVKTLKQTPLMDWIKTIHVDFYLGFHKFLADNFNFWGVKQDNGEYIWFCVMNESCQSGMLLQYIAIIEQTESTKEIKNKCFEILSIKENGNIN